MAKTIMSWSFWALLVLLVEASPDNTERLLSTPDRIARFVLIDSKTNGTLAEMLSGDIVDVESLGLYLPRFSIEAIVSADYGHVGSVVFQLNHVAGYTTENTAPYVLCGKTSLGRPRRCADLDIGHHFVSATAFAEPNGGGEVLQQSSIYFDIVQSHCGVPQVSGSGRKLWEAAQH